MTDTHLPQQPAEPTPFEKFSDAVRKVLTVKKSELDAEVAKERAKRKRRTQKPKM